MSSMEEKPPSQLLRAYGQVLLHGLQAALAVGPTEGVLLNGTRVKAAALGVDWTRHVAALKARGVKARFVKQIVGLCPAQRLVVGWLWRRLP